MHRFKLVEEEVGTCTGCGGTGSEWRRRKDGLPDARYRHPLGPCPRCDGSRTEPVPTEWALHEEPHRHYKRTKQDGKWTWEGRDRARIASVTQVLDGDADRLLQWAVGRAIIAAETACIRYFDMGKDIAASVLDFGALCQLTGLMPDSVRDDKAEIGTAAHEYLAMRLTCPSCDGATWGDLPYGYRCAIDEFLHDVLPTVCCDERGPRVERAVGDERTATAGTYDAQAHVDRCPDNTHDVEPGVHRWDLKSSNTVQPKFYAQVAWYEKLAVLCGEQRSDWLSVLHIDNLGQWHVYSIPTGGPEEAEALAYFEAALALHRGGPRLAKHLKRPPEAE